MKKIFFLFILFGVGLTVLNGQTESSDTSKAIVKGEQMPEFPGGEEAFSAYLDKTLVYPKEAKKKNIQGKVWITFLIDREGNIYNVEIIEGIGGGCDEEAVRVIKNMPKWKPGTQDGKPVIVKFRFPINFILK
jgi:protein TonB